MYITFLLQNHFIYEFYHNLRFNNHQFYPMFFIDNVYKRRTFKQVVLNFNVCYTDFYEKFNKF